MLEDSTANNRIQAFDLGGNPLQVLHRPEESLFPAFDCDGGFDLLGSGGGIQRIHICSFAERESAGFPSGYLSSCARGQSPDLHHQRDECRQD